MVVSVYFNFPYFFNYICYIILIFIFENSKTDSWAQENEERAQVVESFHNALEIYDGKHPIEIKSRGLFEVMAEHLNSGNKGLINKGKGL